MNTNRTIEQVDEKLQGEVGITKRQIGVATIYGQLNSTSRQVNKLLSKLTHYGKSQSCNKNVKDNNQQDSKKTNNQEPKKKDNLISRYNYYGKKYRFQERQELLNIQPVKIQRQCVSQANFKLNSKLVPQSPRTQKFMPIKNIQKSCNATIDHSIFFDDGQIKMPSNNYYICFDTPQERPAMKKVNKSKMDSISNDPALSQKFKPAWFMEKKINSLQKQLKQMKQRQKRRYLNQSVQIRAARNTVDFPIRMQSNIERMVQSLWR